MGQGSFQVRFLEWNFIIPIIEWKQKRSLGIIQLRVVFALIMVFAERADIQYTIFEFHYDHFW